MQLSISPRLSRSPQVFAGSMPRVQNSQPHPSHSPTRFSYQDLILLAPTYGPIARCRALLGPPRSVACGMVGMWRVSGFFSFQRDPDRTLSSFWANHNKKHWRSLLDDMMKFSSMPYTMTHKCLLVISCVPWLVFRRFFGRDLIGWEGI